MSTSCGVCGAYGILLSTANLSAVEKIQAKLEVLGRQFTDDPGDYNSPEDNPKVAKLLKPLKRALLEAGIIVPKGARLFWSGTDDERPARCDTSGGEWIIGFGLLTTPHMYPVMDKSFIEKSQWHTWVWLG